MKRLLYDEGYTIEGAKKRISDERKEKCHKDEMPKDEMRPNAPAPQILQSVKEELISILSILNQDK